MIYAGIHNLSNQPELLLSKLKVCILYLPNSVDTLTPKYQFS